MELIGITATVVQINISIGYLDINLDEMKIAQDGIQHKILEKVIIINCIIKGLSNLLYD